MQRSVVIMKSGDRYTSAEPAYKLAPKINSARAAGLLVEIERSTIPTGQMMYIDPNEIESVRDD